MKKRILSIIVLGITVVLVSLGGHYLYHHINRNLQEPISIIIASDIHYLSSEYRGEYFKEPASYFDGKLTHYSPEYFDAFLAEVIEKHPEILIISGDITLNGSQKSHEEVIEKLTKVQESGIDVLVIPGNHDLDTTAGDYSGETPIAFSSVTSNTFSTLYENFGPNLAISRDDATFSYVYEANPYLRILMLDTNSISPKGMIPSDTFLWIEEQLKDAKRAGADVIAVSHQNLHIHNELLYFSYQFYNADELLPLYEKYNVALNLSGHIHIQSIVTDSAVPEVAVGALSICGTPYGEITYDGKAIEYNTKTTDVSAYAEKMGYTDENLLNFNQYSFSYFEEVGRLQSLSSFAESDLSSEEVQLLADTFGKMNASYFLGEPVDTTEHSNGIALWRSQTEDFTLRYLETILAETDSNNQSITITLH